MKQNTHTSTSMRFKLLLPVAALLVLLLAAACGRNAATPTPEPVATTAPESTSADEDADAEAEEPTEEPADESADESADGEDEEVDAADAAADADASADEDADADADEQPDSPLSQPDSPLSQPDSPLSQPESPLAGPDSYPPPVYTLDVEPGEDTGVVIGKLIAPTPASLVLFAGDIYLGRSDPTVLEKDGETIEVEFLDLVVNEDPKAGMRTPEGEFAIEDVPPGRYGLVIWTPVDSYVLPSDEEEGNFAFFDVEAGEVFDLGNVVIRR